MSVIHLETFPTIEASSTRCGTLREETSINIDDVTCPDCLYLEISFSLCRIEKCDKRLDEVMAKKKE